MLVPGLDFCDGIAHQLLAISSKIYFPPPPSKLIWLADIIGSTNTLLSSTNPKEAPCSLDKLIKPT